MMSCIFFLQNLIQDSAKQMIVLQIPDGDDVTDRLRIGLCHVHVEPAFNLEVEHMTLTSDLVEKLQLEVSASETGLTISGEFQWRHLLRNNCPLM
jgi:hypothetical protein